VKLALLPALALWSGCAAAFTTWVPDDTQDRIVLDDRAPLLRLRRDTLPAQVHVGDDGAIHLVLDLAVACRRIPYGHVVHEIHEHVAMSTLGKIAVAVGLGAIVGSFADTEVVNGPYCTRYSCSTGPHLTYTPAGVVSVELGLALAVTPFLVRSSVRPRTRTREEVDAATVAPWPEGTEVGVSCGDDRAALRAIGDITAVAPWGDELHAHPDAHGEAVFAVARDVSGPWHFVAPSSKLELDWQPE
jgi:hypothetical protein